MKVLDFLTEQIALLEMSHIFGVSGANIEDLFSSVFHAGKTPIVLAKNEVNAATMAMGHYLATKRMTAVFVTSGPGILNTLPAIAEAFSSRIPFLLIAGQVPTTLEGKGAFQETTGQGESFDLLEVLYPMALVKKINSASLCEEAFREAVHYCRNEWRPSVLLIPKNVFFEEMTVSENDRSPPRESLPSSEDLLKAKSFCLSLNQTSAPPLIILGEELIHEKSLDSLTQFIKKTRAAVALTPNSKALWDHYHPQFVGLIGIMGHQNVDNYLEQTSHVLMVGSRMDLLTRLGLEEKLNDKITLRIRAKKAPHESGVLEAQIDLLFSQLCQCLTDSHPKGLVSFNSHEEMSTPLTYNFKSCIELIEKQMDKNAPLFIDAGNTGAFVIHYLKVKSPGVCHVSLGMGGMGNSIGFGIGSAAATGKKSYVFCGDGSFLIHGLELHTAREYKFPVTFFVFNNQSHAMCSTREDLFLGGETGVNDFQYPLNIAALKDLLPGINSYQVNNLDELFYTLLEVEKASSAVNIVSIHLMQKEMPPFKSFIHNNEAKK